MNKEPLIKINNLSIIYDKKMSSEVTAVDNVSLEIHSNDFVVIFGPSGCGKSSLLYALAGIEKNIEEKSEIKIKGKNLATMNENELILFHRQSIGMVFQAFNLVPNLNVLQNVALPQIFAGVDITKRNQRARLLLNRLNISQFAERLPQQLSGGQQQRVGIARALINNTDIILADEPVGNLDSQNAINVLDLLQKLNKEENKTIIMVTHEAEFINYGTKVIYMKDGKIVKEEKILQRKHKPKTPLLLQPEEKETKQEKTTKPQQILLQALCQLPLINTEKLLYYFNLNFTEYERERFDNILKDYLQNKISKQYLLEILDKSFKDGGMGFYANHAKYLAKNLERIKSLATALKRKLEENKNSTMIIKDIAAWLIEDYEGVISSLQYDKIEIYTKERIENKIDNNEFRKNLDKPQSEGGVGFYSQTSKKLSQKIEILIT